jgi:hypothetical protein
MDKIEINYEIDNLLQMIPLVTSPNLSIRAGLTISIRLNTNVFSIENHRMAGKIAIDGGAVAINGEWVTDMGNSPFLMPLEITSSVTYAKLG